jgi:hypothetical protein
LTTSNLYPPPSKLTKTRMPLGCLSCDDADVFTSVMPVDATTAQTMVRTAGVTAELRPRT